MIRFFVNDDDDDDSDLKEKNTQNAGGLPLLLFFVFYVSSIYRRARRWDVNSPTDKDIIATPMAPPTTHSARRLPPSRSK